LQSKIFAHAKIPKLPADSTVEQRNQRRAEMFRLFAPVYSLASRLDAMTGCHFPHDWGSRSGTSDPLEPPAALVADLCLKAGVEDRSGRIDSALQTMATADHVARDLEAEPLILAQRHEYSALRSIFTEDAVLIMRHARDDRVLQSLEQDIRSEAPQPDLAKVLGGEIVRGREVISARKRFDLSMNIWFGDPQPSFFDLSIPNEPIVRDFLDQGFISFWEGAWPQLCSKGGDWKQFRQELIALQPKNKEGALEDTNRTLLDWLWDASGFPPRLQADRRLLLTAIALFKIRNQTGAFPQVLPASLQDGDPVDGRPLRYRKQAQGFDLFNANGNASDPRLDQDYEFLSFVGEQCQNMTVMQYDGNPPDEPTNVVGLRQATPEQPWPHFSFHFRVGRDNKPRPPHANG
jgi:hypothetical protein